MAARFLCSFDHYDTTTFRTEWSEYYLYPSTIVTDMNVNAVRTWGGNIAGSAGCTKRTVFGSNGVSSGVVGFRFKPGIIPAARVFFSLCGPARTHLALWLTGDGTVDVVRSDRDSDGFQYTSGTVLGSGTTAFTVGSTHYLELVFTISDTVGVAKLYVDGNPTPEVDLTNVDTNNAGTGYITFIGLSINTQTGNHTVDDIYAFDTTGGVNDTVAGDVRIDAHFPDANGSDRDWTISTGTDEYDVLNEVVSNTSDYISSTSAGDRTSISVEALKNAGGSIKTVQIVVYLTKMNAGTVVIRPYVLRGGTRYYGTSWYPSWGTWQYFRYLWDVDPVTSAAWTESNFNNTEFGLERTT